MKEYELLRKNFSESGNFGEPGSFSPTYPFASSVKADV